MKFINCRVEFIRKIEILKINGDNRERGSGGVCDFSLIVVMGKWSVRLRRKRVGGVFNGGFEG